MGKISMEAKKNHDNQDRGTHNNKQDAHLLVYGSLQQHEVNTRHVVLGRYWSVLLRNMLSLQLTSVDHHSSISEDCSDADLCWAAGRKIQKISDQKKKDFNHK